MSLSFLRALNPFAAPADADASLRAAKAGGFAGFILAAVTGWDALALHLRRSAFLDAYAAGVPPHPNPEVVAAAQSMGPAILATGIGFQLVFAAALAAAAAIQLRRGGWIPLGVFAAVAVSELLRMGLVFTHGPTLLNPNLAWPVVRFLLALLVLAWTAAALRASMHSRSQPKAP
jgi:hypothetical protein